MVEMRANLQPRISTAQTPMPRPQSFVEIPTGPGEAWPRCGGRRGASPDTGEYLCCQEGIFDVVRVSC